MPTAELDSLFHQLQRRKVESGEWDRYAGRFTSQLPGVCLSCNFQLNFRILLQLRYQLRDSGWMDSTRAQMLGSVTTLTLVLSAGF